jgi:hypothetical protein
LRTMIFVVKRVSIFWASDGKAIGNPKYVRRFQIAQNIFDAQEIWSLWRPTELFHRRSIGRRTLQKSNILCIAPSETPTKSHSLRGLIFHLFDESRSRVLQRETSRIFRVVISGLFYCMGLTFVFRSMKMRTTNNSIPRK